jgi:acylphosphatase
MARRARHLHITGRVQGVGYRAWFAEEARARGLVGWVRNRRDGSVEALIAGSDAQLDAMLEAARGGPSLSHVERIEVREEAAGPGLDELRILPTL